MQFISAKTLKVHQRHLEQAGVKGTFSMGHLVLHLGIFLSVLKLITVQLSMV